MIYIVCEVFNFLILSIIVFVLGMFYNWIEFFMEVVCCKFKFGKYEIKDIIINNSGGFVFALLIENTFSNFLNVNFYFFFNS